MTIVFCQNTTTKSLSSLKNNCSTVFRWDGGHGFMFKKYAGLAARHYLGNLRFDAPPHFLQFSPLGSLVSSPLAW